MTYASSITQMTVAVVSAYARNQALGPADLVKLIPAVGEALDKLRSPPTGLGESSPVPAIAVERSVTRDHIVCLEDGKWFKTLTRHLSSVHGLTPQQYKKKWGLPPDYPMMSSNYAATRHRVAKETRR